MPGDARTASSGSQATELEDALTRMIRFSEKLEHLHQNQIRYSLLLEFLLIFAANLVLLLATLLYHYSVSLQTWICVSISLTLTLIGGFITYCFGTKQFSRFVLIFVILLKFLFCFAFPYDPPVKGLVLGVLVAHAFVWPLSAGPLAQDSTSTAEKIMYFVSIAILPYSGLLTVRNWEDSETSLLGDLCISLTASTVFSVFIFFFLYRGRAATMQLTRSFLSDSRVLVDKLDTSVYLEKVNRLIDSLAEAARASEDPRVLKAVKALVREKSRNNTEKKESMSDKEFLSNQPTSPIVEHLRESYVNDQNYKIFVKSEITVSEKKSAHVFLSTLSVAFDGDSLFRYATVQGDNGEQGVELLTTDKVPPLPSVSQVIGASSPLRSERIRRAQLEASETESQISAQAPEEGERPGVKMDEEFFAPLRAFGELEISENNFHARVVLWNALQDWDEGERKSAESEIGKWKFDAFALAVETQGKPLTTVGYKLIGRELRAMASVHGGDILTVTVRDRLKGFLDAVETRYMNNNPYHNAIHAADVTNSVGALYDLSTDRVNLVGVSRVAGLVAAAIHDVNHLGKSNRWHVQRQDAIGILWNDLSPLENMHAACGFYLLGLNNFLDWLSDAEYSNFRRAVVSAVLATDGKMHMEILKRLRAEDAALLPQISILELFLKTADIGHMAKASGVHVKWTQRVYMEFFAEGDAEAFCGLPVGPLNNRKKVRIDDAQAGFSAFIVRPVFDLLKDWLLSDRFETEVIALLSENENFWKSGKAAVDLDALDKKFAGVLDFRQNVKLTNRLNCKCRV